LEEEHPGVRVVGSYDGRFTWDGRGVTEEDERGAVEAIRAARPDFLFVALGCPKQDYWIARHLHEVDVPVSIGVGGVFDVIAGRVERAPRWMQRSGLEWAHRLAQEPGRLWKRYLIEAAPTVCSLSVSALAKRVSKIAHAR
jgi:N-acetylglucosaminyldiphosphoundecaprenol N-acetyl-beta-D-mannosaminyltransferase